MGKKEEEEIIRIAKKMDKMAQKKSGVRCSDMNGLAPIIFGWCLRQHANAKLANGVQNLDTHS